MLVVDLMHEFELGVWKTCFKCFLRVLNAAAPDGRLVAELDARSLEVNLGPHIANASIRFRQIPTFGRDTIRRFSNNASAMKKLAARDFEDLLQVLCQSK
jgi:hypothetical protein